MLCSENKLDCKNVRQTKNKMLLKAYSCSIIWLFSSKNIEIIVQKQKVYAILCGPL